MEEEGVDTHGKDIDEYWTDGEHWESSDDPDPPFVPEPDQPCTCVVQLKFPESGQPENLQEWYRSFIPKDVVVLEPPRWFIASNPKYTVGFSALLTPLEVEAMERENKPGFVRAFMEGPFVHLSLIWNENLNHCSATMCSLLLH